MDDRPAPNPEARHRRAYNQRRIACSLVERVAPLVAPGVPFDREFSALLSRQRSFGSSDRRLYRELVYAYLRYQPWLDARRGCRDGSDDAFADALIRLASPTREVRALYPTLAKPIPDDAPERDRHRLIGKTDEDLASLLPPWFPRHASDDFSIGDVKTLFQRPPLWIRAQGVPAETLARALGEQIPTSRPPPTPSPDVPGCIKAPADFPLSRCQAYERGRVEPQDIASQALLLLLEPPPQGRWLDACAGAGGKTLQLAALLGRAGSVHAYDPRSQALDELERRRDRAGLANVEILRSLPAEAVFDGVLVDAPCSGSGTWRRHPFLMRQTSEAAVLRHAERQAELLRRYACHVAPGGRLIYATCSLSRVENHDVAAAFLEARADRFEPEPLATRFGLHDQGQGISILPRHLDGDAFYVAAFRRAR